MRHLKVVVTIARTGSLTKAAAALGLAQPALTAQLQRIERALGGPLFERDRRGARPTALGELVLARAAVLLPAMRNLQDEAARLAGDGGTLSRFRVGAVNGSPIVGGLVHRLSEAHPGAQITTYASWSSQELAQMLLTGRLDVALIGVCAGGEAPPGPGLVWRTIALEPVFVLLPHGHPAALHDEIPLGELAQERWLAAPGDGCFGECFVSACARAGFAPLKVYETDVRAGVDLVDAGHAVALCQPTFRPVPGLVTRPTDDPVLRWKLLVGWHPGAEAAALGEQTLALALESYADSVARSSGYTRWLRRHPEHGLRTTQAG